LITNRRILFVVAGVCLALVLGVAAYKTRYEVLPRNVCVVEPGRIYRGGLQQEWPLRRLIQQYKTRTIVSLRGPCEWEETIAREMGVEWISIHMDARSHLHGVADEMLAATAVLADSSKYPIFFHCDRGIERSNMVQAAYRMMACGWTVEEAIAELDQVGLQADTEEVSDMQERKLRTFYNDYVLPHRTATAQSAGTAGNDGCQTASSATDGASTLR
jgi:hypothetical protein